MRLLEIADIGNSPVWRRLWAADSYRHPAYTPAELRAGSGRRPSLYYLPSGMRPAAAGCPGGEFTPAHLVAADTDGPVMGVVLTVERNGGLTYLSSFGRPIYIVEDLAASAPRRRTAARLIHRRIEELRKEYGTEGYHFRDFLSGGRHSGLTELVLRGGGQTLPYFVQMIDLNQPIEVIRSDFRQSLRNILRRSRPGYVTEVITGADVLPEHVRAFHDLHVGFYGRETRTPASWDALLDCVTSDGAFLVFGREHGKYVSAGYFPCSDAYCYYANAVNDRSRYGAGLSHLVLWRAIEYAQQRSCRDFEIGERLYPGQHAGLDAKYYSISHFKAGFGSSVAIRLDVFSGSADLDLDQRLGAT